MKNTNKLCLGICTALLLLSMRSPLLAAVAQTNLTSILQSAGAFNESSNSWFHGTAISNFDDSFDDPPDPSHYATMCAVVDEINEYVDFTWGLGCNLAPYTQIGTHAWPPHGTGRTYTVTKVACQFLVIVDMTVVTNDFYQLRFDWNFDLVKHVKSNDGEYNYGQYITNLNQFSFTRSLIPHTTNDLGILFVPRPPWLPVGDLIHPCGESYGGESGYGPHFPQVIGMIETTETHNNSGTPSAYGGGPARNTATNHTVDPINLCNGSVYVSATDLAIPCPGIPLIFARTYNSVTNYDGPMGANWKHTFDWRLFATNTSFNGQSNDWMVAARGGEESYWFLSTNGTYLSPEETDWTLISTTNSYTLKNPSDGIFLQFGTNGYLAAISDQWCNVVNLSYSNNAGRLLTNVQHNNGQYMNLAYDSSNHLVQISSPATNLTVHYAYNSSGELTNATRITSAGTTTESFLYTTDGMHSLTQRVNAVGDVCMWDYETDGGQSTGRGISNNVAVQYYPTAVSYSDSDAVNEALLTYSKRGTNITYQYYIDPILKRVTSMKWPYLQGDESNSLNLSVTWMSDLDQYGFALTNTLSDSLVGEQTVWACQRDASHNITSESSGYCAAPGNSWGYTWDTNWDTLTCITDPENHKMEFEYTNASLSKIKLYYDANNCYATLLSYTTNGLVSGVTNANGHWTQYYYDSYGFPTSVVPQLGPTIQTCFNQLGYVTNIVMLGDSGPRKISFGVTELGLVTNISYPNGLSETFAYDAIMNMTSHIDTAGRTNLYVYLPTHELSNVVRRLSSGIALTNSVSYDAMFNTIELRDAKNRPVESYALDIQDRVTNLVNLENQTMSVTYGVGDFVKSITRFDGSGVTNVYNGDGLLSSVAFLDDTNTFSYLKNGLLITAGNGSSTISNSWSSANRLDSSTLQMPSLTSQVSYTYYPAGQVSNVVSLAGTNIYLLDAAERVTNLTDSLPSSAPLAFNTSYNTNNGLVSAMTCTNTGVSVQYGYDVMDRVTNIAWKTASSNVLKSFAYQYNNASMITNIALEDGTRLGYSYDDLDRLTGESRSGISNQAYAATYGWDEVGNRLVKTNGSVSVNYSYQNGCNRLTGWSATSTNNFAESSNVDVAGFSTETIGTNQWLGQLYVSNSVSGVRSTPTVSVSNFSSSAFQLAAGSNQLIAAIGDAAGNVGYATNVVFNQIVTNGAYQYNSAGCVTNIAYSGAGFSQNIGLTWNSQYQLTAVSTNGVAAERNGFDALGRRVWNWDGTTTNYFVWHRLHIIADVNATGGLVRSYVWAPGIDNLLAMNVYTGATTRTYFAIRDHLGSIHAMTDESGAIVEQYRFDAWGRTSVYDGNGSPLIKSAIGNRYVWQGREISWNTGIYFHRTRFYDPVVGRWLSKDPSGITGGLNEYTFCYDNPVNFIDPFGDAPYTKEELEAALKAVESGLELRKAQEEALKKGDLKEWDRLQAIAEANVLGVVGQKKGIYKVVDDWEDTPCSHKQSSRYGWAIIRNLFSSKATKQAVTTKYEKERQEMLIEYIKKQLDLLPKAAGDNVTK